MNVKIALALGFMAVAVPFAASAVTPPSTETAKANLAKVGPIESFDLAQLADGIDDVIADLLTDAGYANQNVRDVALCNRLRAIVAQAIEREAPDLAESLWQRDIEESQQAAAEYAADRD